MIVRRKLPISTVFTQNRVNFIEFKTMDFDIIRKSDFDKINFTELK